MSAIPITVFTGFLGAGKTSIILSLLPQLPKDYKVVLLKNEFGDVQVDSKLAAQSSLTSVSEILNGCMCCVLVGQMQTALLEIRDKFHPDRIIIECSGSAFPATLAFQIRELERSTGGDFNLDAIITVVDAENFAGYEDTSPTAKMQASYTDLILINKHEHVSPDALDRVLDHLNTLNDATPKLLCAPPARVDPTLIFGTGTGPALFPAADTLDLAHADGVHTAEVETLTLYLGPPITLHDAHTHEDDRTCNGCSKTSASFFAPVLDPLPQATLVAALDALSGAKEHIWRVKGFLRLSDTMKGHTQILNWAFGRYTLTPFVPSEDDGHEMQAIIRLTVMGERGEVRRAVRRFSAAVGASII
ncbi:hypothetical protein H0H81_004634 [Sphagnurus paluster]|uniref:CobW/HypB/UreG nucleotide-binding domain-containing protein n=1 Tax=Sphagnurus paluster TaxID=117069 RepID=A0A9P7FRY1_9AGAR|nr:hypothetical protein H0H81_004634 [Sphagnurus paluster]